MIAAETAAPKEGRAMPPDLGGRAKTAEVAEAVLAAVG